MIQAIVAVLPVPVAPSMVWKRSPAWMPSESSAIACGWSPVGRYASDVVSCATPAKAIDGSVAQEPAALLGSERAASSREPHFRKSNHVVEMTTVVADPLAHLS